MSDEIAIYENLGREDIVFGAAVNRRVPTMFHDRRSTERPESFTIADEIVERVLRNDSPGSIHERIAREIAIARKKYLRGD